MANEGSLQLTLVDERGEQISGKAQVELRHQQLESERKVVKDADASKTIKIEGLRAAPEGFYKLSVRVTGFLPVRQFLSIRSNGPTRVQLSLRGRSQHTLIDEALELAREGIDTQRRVENLLHESLSRSENPANSDVYRLVFVRDS